MTGWTWSPKALRWHEWLMFSLAFVAVNEGPLFYSDLMRGIAVGLFISALVVMLANRRALFAMACALGVFTAFGMTPRSATTGLAVIKHVLSAWMLLVPIFIKWQELRGARVAEAPQI